MDWLTFFSNIISAVAWPIAAVILVVLFKDEIKKVTPYVKRLKAGPLEAEFEREVKELTESTTTNTDQSPASKALLYQLAEMHPRSAILESWVRVEAAARAVIATDNFAPTKTSYVPAARLTDTLLNLEVLDQSQTSLFNELRRLRNEVAHEKGIEPTQDSALSYIDLASSLQAIFERKLNNS